MLYLMPVKDSTLLSNAVIVQSQKEERHRIARALQSGPAQVLANAALEIEACLRLMNDQPDTARAGLNALLTELREGLSAVRVLIAELQPPLLGELGLEASVQKYAADFSKRTGIAVTLVGWDLQSHRLPPTMETAIFRIVQEALGNVEEHAVATQVQIDMERSSERLSITIADNGQGFVANLSALSSERRLGIVAMRDHAEWLGGQLQVYSDPGRGARVVVSVPLHGHAVVGLQRSFE